MEVLEPAVAYHKQLSVEAYEQLELETDCRHEYWYGEVFAMAGAVLAHNEIAQNCVRSLWMGKPKHCRTFQEGAKLQMQLGSVYVYPDAMLTCHPEDFIAEKYVQHPGIVVEVLSPSTELHDRTTKWHLYRQIKSLRYFLLISAEKCMVEMYSRPHEHHLFQFQAFQQMTDTIDFEGFGFGLTLAQIYEGVNLTAAEEPTPEAWSTKQPEHDNP
jgi:Uma2 family endonuclease